MSKINELIKELCPNGVIYKNIKELCRENFWVMPSTPNYQNEGIPYITSKNIKNGKVMFNNVKYITENDYKSISSNRPIKENDFLISMIGTIGEVGIVKKEDLPFYCQNMYLLRLNVDLINIKYFYHYFTSSMVRNLLIGEKNNGNQGYLKTKNIEMLKVPVPPLEVQEEIVKILDKFGKLEAELEAELEARKNQYEFWRGKLLDKNDNLKSIGELFEFKNGINKSKECFGTGNLIINYVDVYKNNKITNDIVKGLVELNDTDLIRYSCKSGDVFFTRTSETREEVGIASVLIDDMNDSVFSGFLLRARPITDLLIPEYCAYCFSSPRVRRDIISYANFTTRATVTGPILSKVKIYVPSKEEQKRIVYVLDKMYYLINSFIDGIPAEIELRRKQYEYYRNKLLNFEELSYE